MPALAFDRVSKSYGGSAIFDGLSFELEPGQCLCMFGPSGCGKTTSLRLTAGLERTDAGTVSLFGRTVSGNGRFVPPRRRNAGMVFQDQALWPHLDARRHLELVVRETKRTRKGRVSRVHELLDVFELVDKAGARPAGLSGGERQRLALARALASDPAILLLDEAFANLDAPRVDRFAAYFRQQKERGLPILMATHERREITLLADAVIDLGQRPP